MLTAAIENSAARAEIMNGPLRSGKVSNKTLRDFISLKVAINETNLNDSEYTFLMVVIY